MCASVKVKFEILLLSIHKLFRRHCTRGARVDSITLMTKTNQLNPIGNFDFFSQLQLVWLVSHGEIIIISRCYDIKFRMHAFHIWSSLFIRLSIVGNWWEKCVFIYHVPCRGQHVEITSSCIVCSLHICTLQCSALTSLILLNKLLKLIHCISILHGVRRQTKTSTTNLDSQMRLQLHVDLLHVLVENCKVHMPCTVERNTDLWFAHASLVRWTKQTYLLLKRSHSRRTRNALLKTVRDGAGQLRGAWCLLHLKGARSARNEVFVAQPKRLTPLWYIYHHYLRCGRVKTANRTFINLKIKYLRANRSIAFPSSG